VPELERPQFSSLVSEYKKIQENIVAKVIADPEFSLLVETKVVEGLKPKVVEVAEPESEMKVSEVEELPNSAIFSSYEGLIILNITFYKPL